MRHFENEYMIARMEGDVFIGEYKRNAVIDLEAAKKIVAFRNEIVQQDKIKLLIIHSEFVTIAPDAKKYFVNEGTDKMSMFALVDKSYFSSLLGNAFLKVMTPKLPTKIFRTEKAALDWLKT